MNLFRRLTRRPPDLTPADLRLLDAVTCPRCVWIREGRPVLQPCDRHAEIYS
jgi:hypothetical protein